MMKNLIVILCLLIGGSSLFAEEIPNGDNDLIWEQDISPRFVNDAKFHPITGNIIAAVNHEIWEIDVKDGHKIRVFEGGPASGPYDQFHCVEITSDGKFVITGRGSGIEGLIIRDYETGKIAKTFINGEKFDGFGNLGIFPDNNRIVFFTYLNDDFYFNIYDISLDKIVKRIKSNKWPDEFALSKDGKYLAMGTRWNDGGSKLRRTMELWDAETLTYIRDFGEAVNANEFWDVKISNDNQYFGFMANNKYYFFKIDGVKLDIAKDTEPSSFCFDETSKFIIFSGGFEGKGIIKVLNIELMKIFFEFNKIQPFKNYLLNTKNQFFSGYSILRLFSNRWYTVDVKDNQIESTFKINYSEKKLIIENSTNQILASIEITDINGKILHSTNLNQNTQSTLEFEFKLIPGVYFATIQTASGKIFSQKFMVLE